MFVTGIVKIALKTEPKTKRLVMRHSAGAPIEKCHVIDVRGEFPLQLGLISMGFYTGEGRGGGINLCKSHPAFMQNSYTLCHFNSSHLNMLSSSMIGQKQ